MDKLVRRLRAEAHYLGNGIIKVDGFLNHQVDSTLMTAIGQELAERFSNAGATGLTKVLTAETSGIPPALATAQALDIPMLYARKKRPVTLAGDCYRADSRSHTKGTPVTLHVAAEYLGPDDRIVLVDDFLGTGETTRAMLDIIGQSGAQLFGIGFVLEKVYEHGRAQLLKQTAPVISLARIDLDGEQLMIEGPATD